MNPSIRTAWRWEITNGPEGARGGKSESLDKLALKVVKGAGGGGEEVKPAVAEMR